MDFELVLCLTGLLLVTGWIPGEGLGCKVTRPIVELDALHTFHSNHRENFRVYTVVGIVVILDFGAQYVLLGLSVNCGSYICSSSWIKCQSVDHWINSTVEYIN